MIVQNGSDNELKDGADEETTALPEADGTLPKTHPAAVKTLTKRERRMRTALRWILINIGALMMSSSVYFFQVQNNFTMGGMAGISIILSNFITPLVPFLTQAVIMGIINVVLLIIGFIILGKQCTFRTIYCSLVYTGLIWVFEKFVHLQAPLTDQPFLELCFAILLLASAARSCSTAELHPAEPTL